jgi:hypothetical protein
LKDHSIYALGAEVDGRLVNVWFLKRQDDGKTLYEFGARTHPDFQRGNVKSSINAAIENLVYPYEPNVTKLRSATYSYPCAMVNILNYIGFQQIYCYQAFSFQHNDPRKAAGKVSHLIQSMMAGSNIRAIRSQSDYNLIGPTTVCHQTETIVSPLVPAGVLIDPTCLYTANRYNIRSLQGMGYLFFISGCREPEKWRPAAEVFSYGGITSLSVRPIWACSINTDGDPNPNGWALLHVLTHAQLATDRALQFGAKGSVAQLVCLFNSEVLKKQAYALLSDSVGFEESASLKGPGLNEPYAVFEKVISIK